MLNGKLTTFDHLDEVWVRHTNDTNEDPTFLSFFKKRSTKSEIVMEGKAPMLYPTYPIPIKKAKANNLHKLVSSYVPLKHQGFYSQMSMEESEPDDHEDI